MTKRDLIWISITAVFLILMAVCASAADVGGSCPKPLPAIVKHHKKHVAAVPLCTCVSDAPRTIMLPAPEPDIDAIPLSVYPYYTIISANDEPPAATFEDWEPGYYGYYGWAAGIGTSHTTTTTGQGFRRSVGPPTPRVQRTPEIGADSAGAALTLLAGALAVMRGRRSQADGMAELMTTVRVFDLLPEARKIIDELRHEAADWKERALNAERRLQVYSSRAQSDTRAEHE